MYSVYLLVVLYRLDTFAPPHGRDDTTKMSVTMGIEALLVGNVVNVML